MRKMLAQIFPEVDILTLAQKTPTQKQKVNMHVLTFRFLNCVDFTKVYLNFLRFVCFESHFMTEVQDLESDFNWIFFI